MSKNVNLLMRQVAKEHGFTPRGNAFFRVIGDGVFQILKFEFERGFSHYTLGVGLQSMFSELKPQSFTSSGCILRYYVVNFIGKSCSVITNEENGLWSFNVVSPEEQVDILNSRVFPQLDEMQTQQELVNSMCQLDIIRFGSVIWNDIQKLAPYLQIGDLKNAEKVVQAIRNQYIDSLEKKRSYLDSSSFAAVYAKSEKEISVLNQKLTAIRETDFQIINAYLRENYQINSNLAKFCIAQK